MDAWEDMWADTDSYGRVGMVLGAIVGVLTFLSIWIATWFAGFVIGFVLGWIPAAFFAAIAFLLVRFLWGFAALGALLLFLQTTHLGS